MRGCFLIQRVRQGRDDQGCQVGRRDAVFHLQSLGETDVILIFDLVVHPVAEEFLFLTGQSH